MRNDDRDELDSLIDGALPDYARAEPLEGLEDRVLRRVQAANATRRSPWSYRLAFAIPAAIALLIAGLALRTQWRRPALVTNTIEVVSSPEARPPAPEPQPLEPEFEAPPRSLPKEECFPARVPMTEEERALVAWVMRSPTEASQAFAELAEPSAEPIEIQPIEIPPLQSDGAP